MKKIFLGFIISTALFSCKKDEATTATTNPTTKTKTQYLTQKSWKDSIVLKRTDTMSAWTLNSVSMVPCSFDNALTFKTDSTFVFDNGALKCISSDPQTIAVGTWKFASNETHLNFFRITVYGSTLNQSQDWTIEQLDENIFTYRYYYPGTGPYYKITMVH